MIDDPRAGTTCPTGPDGIQGEEGVAGRETASAPTPGPSEPRRRGRPRTAADPLGSVTVHLPTPAQDRIIRLAAQRRQAVSEYLRDVMTQLFGGRS